MPDRRHHRLITIDRVLLGGVLTVGIWVGANDIRRVELEARIIALEPQVAELKTAKAVIETKLENIEKLLQVVNSKLDAQDRREHSR